MGSESRKARSVTRPSASRLTAFPGLRGRRAQDAARHRRADGRLLVGGEPARAPARHPEIVLGEAVLIVLDPPVGRRRAGSVEAGRPRGAGSGAGQQDGKPEGGDSPNATGSREKAIHGSRRSARGDSKTNGQFTGKVSLLRSVFRGTAKRASFGDVLASRPASGGGAFPPTLAQHTPTVRRIRPEFRLLR